MSELGHAAASVYRGCGNVIVVVFVLFAIAVALSLCTSDN